jgi:uncharacterized protein (UPF0332 family)
MIKFEDKYFEKFAFAKQQIQDHLMNSLKDLSIAIKVDILDVKFNYAYTSLLKAGIALLSFHGVRVKSVPGHQVKIIQKLAQLLNDSSIEELGNIMRSKRNLDFYGGGIEITEKECRSYIKFVEGVVNKVGGILKAHD